jgi:hypothetical protein
LRRKTPNVIIVRDLFKYDCTVAGNKPSGNKMTNNEIHKATLGCFMQIDKMIKDRTIPTMKRGAYSVANNKNEKPEARAMANPIRIRRMNGKEKSRILLKFNTLNS